MSNPVSNFLSVLRSIESSGNYNARASTSTASGAYQFTHATATALGLPWGTNSSLPFGGASVSNAQQDAAALNLTTQNASALQAQGIPITNSTLYAAHFLGAGNASSVLGADPSTPLSSILPSNVFSANPFLQGMTAGGFGDWLGQKTGGGSPFDAGTTFRPRKSSLRPSWLHRA